MTAKSCVKFLAIALVFFPLVYFVHPVLGIAIYSAQAVPLLIGIVTLVFVVLHMAPGDPTAAYFNPNVSPDVIDQVRRTLLIGQRQEAICRAAKLERTGVLQVLELQEHVR